MQLDNKSLDRFIKRKIHEYDNSGSATGLSQEEILSIASGLKRKKIPHEEMQKIGIDAEMHFRRELKLQNQELFELYILLKIKKITGEEARQGWGRVERGIDERRIKQEYINNKIAINSEDKELIPDAIVKIVIRSYQERLRLLLSELDCESVNFIMNLESRINQVNYPTTFNRILLSVLKNRSPFEFLYLLCLRYRHENGEFGVVNNLEPFSFQDIYGRLQKRDGTSKKFQLDTAMELSRESRNIGNISHKIVVMDTDLDNFLISNQTHKNQIDEYINSVKGYVGKTLEVVSASKYFKDLGFEDSEYEKYIKLLSKNNGSFFSIEEYNELLKKNMSKVSRTLKWNEEQNDFYTASLIARNILIGETSSSETNSRVHCVFNKNAAIGYQFNIKSLSPILFLALPIYEDNIGSIEYA